MMPGKLGSKWNFPPKCCFGGSASPSSPSTTIEDLCHRFSLAQLRDSTNNFDLSHKIGEGTFGELYRGRISIHGEQKEIAVKWRYQGALRGFSEFRNEILMTCQLFHPNLVSLVGFCDDQNEMMVVYEYIPNRSLDDQLHGRDSTSTKLSWKKRLEISIGVARGLHYLHVGTKRTISHRDVKPTNILLGENWIPKIADFGLSLKGPKYSSKAKIIKVDQFLGTAGYAAPEHCTRNELIDKSDVYGFGVVLLELICGKKPRQKDGDDSSSLVNIIAKIKEMRNIEELGNAEKNIDPRLVGEIAVECWKLYMDIVKSCLREDPNERPHMGEVEVDLERALQLQQEADASPQLHAFH